MRVKLENRITQSRLKEFLDYNPETGDFTWKVSKGRSKAGSIAGGKNITLGYWQLRIDNQLYWAHRLAWLFVYGELPEFILDHINGDKQDNRIANLRLCPNGNSDNAQNRTKPLKNNSSGLLGAYFFKRANKFMSSITVGGKQIHLGYFDSAEDAHAAYKQAKAKYHQFNAMTA